MPVSTADSTHFLFNTCNTFVSATIINIYRNDLGNFINYQLLTGNVPGMAQSKNETHELVGRAKSVDALENNFDSVAI